MILLVRDEDGAGARAAGLADELRAAGVRVELDDRVATGFGRRAVEWEVKGVPVRIEIGARDVAAGTATLVRRDTPGKEPVSLDGLAATVVRVLDEIQASLLRQAQERLEARTTSASTLAEAREAAASGFVRVPWDEIRGHEDELAKDALTVRCLQRADGSVPMSSAEDGLVAVVAKAY